jgi:hypothetical protein
MNYEDPGWESVYSSSSALAASSPTTATAPTSPSRERVRTHVSPSAYLSPERVATASGSAPSTSASTLRVRSTLRSRAGSTNTALSSGATSNTGVSPGGTGTAAAEEDNAYSSDERKAKARYHAVLSRKKSSGLSKTHPLVPSVGESPSTTPGLWRATEGRFSSEEETRPRWLLDAKASAERKDARRDKGKRRAATDGGEVDELEVLEHKVYSPPPFEHRVDEWANVFRSYEPTLLQEWHSSTVLQLRKSANATRCGHLTQFTCAKSYTSRWIQRI